jgi:phosphate transport system permease protein
MSISLLLLIIAVIGVAGYLVGSWRANALSGGKPSNMHSRTGYYGSFVAIWAMLPAIVVLLVWIIGSPLYISSTVRAGFPDEVKAEPQATQNLNYNMIGAIARGLRLLSPEERAGVFADGTTARTVLAGKGVPLAADPAPYMLTSADDFNRMTSTSSTMLSALVIAAALAGAFLSYRSIAPKFRARNRVEGVMLVALIGASSIAILTTVGIVASMATEAISFFNMVPAWQFFFGTTWDPRFAAAGATDSSGQFGLIPLLAGTLYIGFVAMLVAVPVGLFAAIYMSEYASRTVRSVAKPLLEVLAGIPTIVYGFFALVTVGPFLRDISAQLNGLVTGNYSNFIQAQSVLTAGFVMGVMLIPFVSSLSDDIINAVPQSLREGSLRPRCHAVRNDQARHPAGRPARASSARILLTASRAIGETMIVVLAAGIAPNLTLNPFEPVTTITVKIVSQLTGDLEFNSPQTLVAFALGFTLFVFTLCLNIYALYIVRKYREQYE